MLSTDGKMYRKQNPKRESDQRLIDFQFVIKELSQNLFTKAAMSATWQWYNLWGTADPRTPFSTFLSPEDNAPREKQWDDVLGGAYGSVRGGDNDW